jgi:glycosyltransferase involved in cell wall biosynthesis
VLGFFVRWIAECSKYYEQVTVLCLREGTHALPSNVRVISLGTSRFGRLVGLLGYIVVLRGTYDAVLVHMSQEFVLVGGWLLKLLGKPIYLWRNHYAGSALTGFAVFFCTKVFCTSKYSYTAKYKKTVLMPVGVDIETLRSVPGGPHEPRSVLFLARMAPSKHPELLLEALRLLQERGVTYRAAFYGSPLPQDCSYYELLKSNATDLQVTFHSAVTNNEASAVYNRFNIFVNCSPSGMYDKTIFEAAACGCLVLTSSKDFADKVDSALIFEEGSATDLANKIAALLSCSQPERQVFVEQLQAVAAAEDIKTWGRRLYQEMSHV